MISFHFFFPISDSGNNVSHILYFDASKFHTKRLRIIFEIRVEVRIKPRLGFDAFFLTGCFASKSSLTARRALVSSGLIFSSVGNRKASHTIRFRTGADLGLWFAFKVCV